MNVAIIADGTTSISKSSWKAQENGVKTLLDKLRVTGTSADKVHLFVLKTAESDSSVDHKYLGSAQPKTLDQLKQALTDFNPSGSGHTKIQPALYSAKEKLVAGIGAKVIFLMTDGSKRVHGKDPVTYANTYIKPLGIKVITIGYEKTYNGECKDANFDPCQSQPRVKGIASSDSFYLNAYKSGSNYIEDAWRTATSLLPCSR